MQKQETWIQTWTKTSKSVNIIKNDLHDKLINNKMFVDMVINNQLPFNYTKSANLST